MDNVTKAKINLFAVLRAMQELCALDKKSAEIIKDVNLTVGFNVPSVGNAVMSFKDGKCEVKRGKGKAALQLYFTSAEHFNKLVDGEKTIPVFFNVFKAGFLLGPFTQLADRLSYYLQPKDESLFEDKEYYTINTMLTAYVAFFALCEVGNSDAVGKITAKRMPDGIIFCSINDEAHPVELSITVKNATLMPSIGKVGEPSAYMEFFDMDIAHEVLNGKTDTYSAVGQGRFMIRGLIPMLEQMAKLLSQVALYLK